MRVGNVDEGLFVAVVDEGLFGDDERVVVLADLELRIGGHCRVGFVGGIVGGARAC